MTALVAGCPKFTGSGRHYLSWAQFRLRYGTAPSIPIDIEPPLPHRGPGAQYSDSLVALHSPWTHAPATTRAVVSRAGWTPLSAGCGAGGWRRQAPTLRTRKGSSSSLGYARRRRRRAGESTLPAGPLGGERSSARIASSGHTWVGCHRPRSIAPSRSSHNTASRGAVTDSVANVANQAIDISWPQPASEFSLPLPQTAEQLGQRLGILTVSYASWPIAGGTPPAFRPCC
jgi:hypothetical protein